MRPERQFVLVHAFRCGDGVPEIIAETGLQHLGVRALDEERVLVLIQIDVCVGAEVHRIGTRDERAIVVIGIKRLYRDGFPAAGRAAVHEAGPSLTDSAKLFFQRRNQFGFDGVAVGTQIVEFTA